MDPSNYGIDQGVTINGITRLDDSHGGLAPTSPMAGGLSVHSLDPWGAGHGEFTPNTIAPTQVDFRTYVFQVGAVVHKKYTDPTPVNGTSFATLTDRSPVSE